MKLFFKKLLTLVLGIAIVLGSLYALPQTARAEDEYTGKLCVYVKERSGKKIQKTYYKVSPETAGFREEHAIVLTHAEDPSIPEGNSFRVVYTNLIVDSGELIPNTEYTVTVFLKNGFKYSYKLNSGESPRLDLNRTVYENVYENEVKISADENGTAEADAEKVLRGSTVNIKAVPKEGYRFSGWQILEGNPILKNAKSAETSFEMPETGVSLKAVFTACGEFPFIDVEKKEGDWTYEAVKFVNDNDIMTGIKNDDGSINRFAPKDPVTRGMLVTILHRMSGTPATAFEGIFDDVGENAYYAKAAVWAKKNGIVSGISERTFCPKMNVTREQVAKMLFEWAEFNGRSVEKRAKLDSFKDASDVATWAEDAVKWAVGEEVIYGKDKDGATCIDPKGTATRAEIAAMIQRYLSK